MYQIIGRPEPSWEERGIEATYDYTDESGKLLYQVVRLNGKQFRQRRPSSGAGWTWGLGDVRRVPYRLPRVIASPFVSVVEGEKDVHTLERLGFVATCNNGGAGHFTAEMAQHLKGKKVAIFADNDDPGREHALKVAALANPIAAAVKIVELPGLPPKGDVSDFVAAGGTAEQLREFCRTAQQWTPEWQFSSDRRGDSPAAGKLETRRVSDIEAKPVNWLWPGRIARGKVSIIAGNPGLGKSQITASIAAIVSTGGLWPVDRNRCSPGAVVFLSAEDDPADTLRPRLEAAGANLHHVHVLDAVVAGYAGDGAVQHRAFNLERDLAALSAKLAELGNVSAVVIDPITAYLGEVDSHRNAEVRALLAPLSDLAARHEVAIIGVSHLNKSAGTEALMRVTGSLAFVAAARAAYLVAQDPEDNARRFFLPMKNNIGPDSTGLAFRIEGATVPSGAGPLQTSKVTWESDPVAVTADEVMRPTGNGPDSALSEAAEWLTEILTEPTPAQEVFHRAASAGIAGKTVRRAADSIGVRKEKTGMRGGWAWSLPPKMAKSPEGAQEKCLGIFGDLGHLREREDTVEVEI